MNIFLWILQGLLAAMFLMAGIMKATKSKDEIKESGGERMAWVDSVSAGNVRLIGILELLAAIGLILPQLTGILPWLTPLAAVGLVLTMIGAMALHLQRGDGTQAVVASFVILLLAAFVAYGRFVLIPA
ncbi:MAG: DoxX family protein [Chloroflexi bacterium]|nr:DoxX family protein [Chloroflexota bacterium]